MKNDANKEVLERRVKAIDHISALKTVRLAGLMYYVMLRGLRKSVCSCRRDFCVRVTSDNSVLKITHSVGNGSMHRVKFG